MAKHRIRKNKRERGKWDFPQAVTQLELVFGGSMDKLLPLWDELPEAYKDPNSRRPSIKFVSQWFFQGLKGLQLVPRKDVDPDRALNHIKACLSSWEPKHEHKTGGVAFLVDHFFEKATTDAGSYEFSLDVDVP